MGRSTLRAPLVAVAFALIALAAPSAVGHVRADLPGVFVDVRVLRVALPEGGRLTSVVAMCETMDIIDDPTFGCGNTVDTASNRVTAQITGRPAGERWTLTL